MPQSITSTSPLANTNEHPINESALQLEHLMDNLKAGIVVHNPDTSIALCNKEACILLGLSMDQMLGKEAISPEWCFRDEDGNPLLLQDYPVNKVIATLKPLKDSVGVIERASNNDLVWVLVNAYPEFDDNNVLKRVVVTFIDITKIKTSEKLLHQVSNLANAGGWELNFINNTLLLTDVAKEIYELPLNEQPTIAEAINLHKEGYSRNTLIKILKEAKEDKKHFDYELEIVIASGISRWVRIIGMPEFVQQKCVKIYGIIQDITQQIEANKAIRESHERFEYATKATFDAIWDWNLVTDDFFRGEGFETLFGHNHKDDITSKMSWNEIHPDDKERVIASIKAVCNSNDNLWRQEFRFLKSDGKYADVVDKAVIIRNQNGQAQRMIGAMHDITKTKERAQQMRLLESVVTNSNDMIVITEAEPFSEPGPKILYVNEAFTKITGYTKEEVIGKTPRILQGEKTDRNVLDSLKQKMQNWEISEAEVINYKKNGEEFWNNFTVVPIANKQGWFTHWISIERDVTERKKGEFEKEQLIKELTKSNIELKQFSYITSHNLRAPLTNLLAIFSLLETNKIEDPLTVQLIESLRSSTFQLNDTLNELLKVVIIKENTNKQLGLISLAKAMESVQLSINAIISNSGTIIHRNFSEAPDVYFDKSYIDSILINLLTNAIKYAHPNRRPEIRFLSKKVSGGIQIIVSDNGIGFNMEKVKDKIFGLYQRFHNHPDSKGFGLYLIHAQITSLGGTISVDSIENEGTTFTIFLKE